MNLDTMQTDLALYLEGGAEIVIPYEASVGISQSLSPISEGAEMRRGVNGQLIVVASPLFRKYETEVSCRDMSAPTLGDVWIGQLVTIRCVATLSQRIAAGAATLARDPVSGSVVCYNAAGDEVAHTCTGRSITAAGAARVVYRPILSCAVTAFSIDEDEISGDVSWSISATEV